MPFKKNVTAFIIVFLMLIIIPVMSFAQIFRVSDPAKDVGMPAIITSLTAGDVVSGWDMTGAEFSYDAGNDVMTVSVDFSGICGDADGDGNPGSTAQSITDIVGQDLPDLGGSESVVLLIDTDNDGNADVAVGVNSAFDMKSFAVYKFQGQGFLNPSFPDKWREKIADVSELIQPSALNPGLMFSINSFSGLPGFTHTAEQEFSFRVQFFAGSQSDGGIGEDFMPNIAQEITIR